MREIRFEIGTKVYLVWNQCHSPKEVTITKIGRKYAEIDRKNIKINMDTLSAGEGSTIAKVYFSKEDYEEEKELFKLWETIRRKVGNVYKKPESITKYNMLVIINILDNL